MPSTPDAEPRAAASPQCSASVAPEGTTVYCITGLPDDRAPQPGDTLTIIPAQLGLGLGIGLELEDQTSLWMVPSVADLAAPTVAEMKAGFRLG